MKPDATKYTDGKMENNSNCYVCGKKPNTRFEAWANVCFKDYIKLQQEDFDRQMDGLR